MDDILDKMFNDEAIITNKIELCDSFEETSIISSMIYRFAADYKNTPAVFRVDTLRDMLLDKSFKLHAKYYGISVVEPTVPIKNRTVKFTLNEADIDKYDKWKSGLKPAKGKAEMSFTFTPTGLGMNVSISRADGETLNL